ncbi:MAG: DUF4417 domain-containing protein [Lachnospiraceae bacterium]|mgnify:CR=1 FL=1|nr:DUF4417 domain-containing protein [Lachnospiraceae bacterium]
MMTSQIMRLDPLFTRNEYTCCGRWDIPLVKKQEVDLAKIRLISYSDTRSNDRPENKKCGVHFFIDDYRFESIYRSPEKSLLKLSQYAFLLTPDYSTYADMNQWRQLESVAHNRWCGAYWQSKGLTVIPTVSWSTPASYSYSFDGIEKGAIVAIGMIGCKKNKSDFMHGYNTMLERIQPEAIICFGNPFSEMTGNLITVDYCASRKAVR